MEREEKIKLFRLAALILVGGVLGFIFYFQIFELPKESTIGKDLLASLLPLFAVVILMVMGSNINKRCEEYASTKALLASRRADPQRPDDAFLEYQSLYRHEYEGTTRGKLENILINVIGVLCFFLVGVTIGAVFNVLGRRLLY